MRTLIITACILLLPVSALAKNTADSTPKKSPFYELYPAPLAPAAEAYFGAWNKVFFKSDLMSEKDARIIAMSSSSAMKCEYCITAQAVLGEAAGATPDELKAATQIAAEVARFSILLYGNEFGQDNLKKVLKKMMAKPAKKKKPGQKSAFYTMYPAPLADAAESYFGTWNKVLFKSSLMSEKIARLAAVAASAAMKCEYCITAQVALAKAAGATDDEIKAAIQIAAEVARFSILLYGNDFGQDNLDKVIKKMLKK